MKNKLVILLFLLISLSASYNLHSAQMTSKWDEAKGTLRILRKDTLLVVYQRNTDSTRRSIANAITELYAVGKLGRPENNLLADHSALVPPQIFVGVNDTLIKDTCIDQSGKLCDYFVHHKPQVTILQSSGDKVVFHVEATATQHNDKKTPLQYLSEMTFTVPFHPLCTVIECSVKTSLRQRVYVSYALRPLPFYELVNNPYDSVSYLDADCKTITTVPIPKKPSPDINTVFIQDSTICLDRPWAAIYLNDKGNLGMILQAWNWSSGKPELRSYTETIAHPGEPNLYFQSTDHSRIYKPGEGVWTSKLIFLAYTNAKDYSPVKQFRDRGIKNSVADGLVEGMPSSFRLKQNYPNPFKSSTIIEYFLPASSHVELKLYDILGHEIKTLVNSRQIAGLHVVSLDSKNLPMGLYFCSLKAENLRETIKLVIAK